MVLRPTLPPPIQPFSRTATLRTPILLGEVIGRRESVPAAADDDDVVIGPRLRIAPLAASSPYAR